MPLVTNARKGIGSNYAKVETVTPVALDDHAAFGQVVTLRVSLLSVVYFQAAGLVSSSGKRLANIGHPGCLVCRTSRCFLRG